MTDLFPAALALILKWEGGLVDNPYDPGGLTNMGIALRYHPELTADDIRAMTPERAGKIYRTQYWNPCRCDELPWGLALMLFDAAVNQGVGAAARMLQTAVGVTADGIIGPKTLRAALARTSAVEDLFAARSQRYHESSGWPTFGGGWMTRLLKCHAAALAVPVLAKAS